jgi:tripartite-type tricarboxylate transporter receptor subunit TctC
MRGKDREKTMTPMSRPRGRALMIALAAACAVAMAAAAARAQPWPSRTITAVVPLSAGNAIDVVARAVLEQLSRQLGQPIVVENRVGAGGTLGANAVAKAAPDGYTLLVHSSSFSASNAIYANLPYDTLKDFIPVIALGNQPTVLVTAPSKGFATLGDLVAAAKAKPGALNFASAGVGAASHLAAERFRLAAGFQAQHVPFRGPNEALTDVMAGRVDFYFLPLAPALPLLQEGKLSALAVSTPTRSSALPNVPTTVEAGLQDASYLFWTAMFVPANTPRPIVDRLHEETRKALETPVVRERLARLAVEPFQMTAAEFEAYFRNDLAATIKLVREAGIPRSH